MENIRVIITKDYLVADEQEITETQGLPDISTGILHPEDEFISEAVDNYIGHLPQPLGDETETELCTAVRSAYYNHASMLFLQRFNARVSDLVGSNCQGNKNRNHGYFQIHLVQLASTIISINNILAAMQEEVAAAPAAENVQAVVDLEEDPITG